MKEVLLSVDEAADRMHCSTSWIYTKIREGALKCVRSGRMVHVREEDLEQFIREEHARQQRAVEQKLARAARKPGRAGKRKGANHASNRKP